MAERGGASALLVFPPNSMSMGGQLRPEMALAHFRRIADATDLPLIVFQYPLASGLGYPLETLLRLARCGADVRAIKDWCNDPMLHERHIRTLKALPRPVNVLSTHSAWLMSSLVLGCQRAALGLRQRHRRSAGGAVGARSRRRISPRRSVNDRIYPLAQAFYAPPFLDMHNRMKEALVLLGRLQRAVVRPPLMKLPAARDRASSRRRSLPPASAAPAPSIARRKEDRAWRGTSNIPPGPIPAR